MSTEAASGRIRRKLERFSSSDEQIEAQELLESSKSMGGTAIGACDCGDIVTVCGPLRSVTIKPVSGLPTVEAEMYDGSGRVALVWMGRRQIIGIEPGRVLTATGRLGTLDGRRVMFNPRYTLRPEQASE